MSMRGGKRPRQKLHDTGMHDQGILGQANLERILRGIADTDTNRPYAKVKMNLTPEEAAEALDRARQDRDRQTHTKKEKP